MKKKLIILLICGISLLAFSCGNLKKNEEEKKADLNKQNVEIKSKIKLAFLAQKDIEVIFWNSKGKISDKHGLIEQSEGRLTSEGHKLISLGKIFGLESSIYIDYLTKLVLAEGKHLILIQDLETFKETALPKDFLTEKSFKIGFDKFLESNNSIGPRKPGRKTTGNKNAYIRDEFKLWNKLGLLKHRKGSEGYFVKGRGIEFNWSRITDILTKDFIY